MTNFVRKTDALKITAIIIWVVFTVSLTIWWYIFSIKQLDLLSALNLDSTATVIRNQNMLLWEGTTLIICLFAGGLALAFAVYKDSLRNYELRQFFAAFTHELKTPLTSIQLQIESLQADGKLSPTDPAGIRLLAESSRLTLQLENALYLADPSLTFPISEKVRLFDIIQELRYQIPAIDISCDSRCTILGDSRALLGVFRNLVNNSHIHGRAGKINVTTVADSSEGSVAIRFSDDGGGFKGERKRLGRLFHRHYSGSGNGIGLYLVEALVRKMKGSVEFPEVDSGFAVVIHLPGEIETN